MIKAENKQEAWWIAHEMLPCCVYHDAERSERAGYDIYTNEYMPSAWVADTGTRLEVTIRQNTTNIWFASPR